MFSGARLKERQPKSSTAVHPSKQRKAWPEEAKSKVPTKMAESFMVPQVLPSVRDCKVIIWGWALLF